MLLTQIYYEEVVWLLAQLPCVYRYIQRFALQPEMFPISLQGCGINLLNLLLLSAFVISTTYNHHYNIHILLIYLTHLTLVKKSRIQLASAIALSIV